MLSVNTRSINSFFRRLGVLERNAGLSMLCTVSLWAR
jgi:hypothetical protein